MLKIKYIFIMELILHFKKTLFTVHHDDWEIYDEYLHN